MKNTENGHEINMPKEIADLELSAVAGGAFVEEDIDKINVLHGYMLEKYPDKAYAIEIVFSLLENDQDKKFSYHDVLESLSAIIRN